MDTKFHRVNVFGVTMCKTLSNAVSLIDPENDK
jgi:hypothetical protein